MTVVKSSITWFEKAAPLVAYACPQPNIRNAPSVKKQSAIIAVPIYPRLKSNCTSPSLGLYPVCLMRSSVQIDCQAAASIGIGIQPISAIINATPETVLISVEITSAGGVYVKFNSVRVTAVIVERARRKIGRAHV